MRRWLPRSLAGQLGLLVVAAVVVAQAAAFTYLAAETSRVGRAAARTQVVDRVAALVRVIGVAPHESRDAIIRAFGSRQYRFWAADAPQVDAAAMGDEERLLASRIRRLLPKGAGDPRLALVKRRIEPGAADARDQALRPEALELSVRLADGAWLNGEAPLRLPSAPFANVWLSLLVASVAAVVAAVMVAVRWITRPLSALAEAADRVGRGDVVESLAIAGPLEISRTVNAFNVMQKRLSRFLADRLAMLAAISHDLRTPITAARLRAEMIEDREIRNAIIKSLTDMQNITEATLSFAREEGRLEEPRLVDLTSIVEAAADDLRAAGLDVRVTEQDSVPFRGRPTLLRRALTNLMCNAAQYGTRAQVSIQANSDQVKILIDDEGPGLPVEQLERMFEPFTRGDESRSDETGGIGLGLPIARSALRAHGGDVVLRRLKVGLRAEITLPRSREAAGNGDPTHKGPGGPGASCSRLAG